MVGVEGRFRIRRFELLDNLLHLCNLCRVARISPTRRRPSRQDTTVIDSLMALSRAMVAVTTRSLSAAETDVTLTQYRTLIVLASRGPQRVADLAQELAVLPSTVTRLCDRLVARGLVARQPGETDRRVVWVGLTSVGQHLVGEVMAARRAMLAELLATVSLEDPASFARSAERLALGAGELPEQQWWEQWGRSSPADAESGPSALGGTR